MSWRGGCERKVGLYVKSGAEKEQEMWSRNKEGGTTLRGPNVGLEAVLEMQGQQGSRVWGKCYPREAELLQDETGKEANTGFQFRKSLEIQQY